MDKQTLARIDLERLGQTSIIRRGWFPGYDPRDAGPANVEDVLDSGSIPQMLALYEKRGYVVWMATGSQGRALAGETTRVDIVLSGDTSEIRKYCYGWSAKTPPKEKKITTEEEARAAIQWLRDNKWTLMEYADRCSAFKGRAVPIHDKPTILTMRRKALENRVNFSIDFAFYPSGGQ
jgi:hypothetical protein